MSVFDIFLFIRLISNLFTCSHDILKINLYKQILQFQHCVKIHYSGQKISSQILFFEIMQFSTSTKPILKDIFIKYTQNKVVQ
jgi:hypothetical protein